MTQDASRRFYEGGEWDIQDRAEVEWLVSRLRQLLGQQDELVVLDLGCGDGALTERVLKQVDGVHALGIDVSYHALTRSMGTRLQVAQAQLDGELLPVAPNSIDVVILSQVIEHMVDTDGLTGEIVRVLKPGGTLLLSTPNLASWFNRVMLLLGMQPVFSEVSFRRVFGRPGHVIAGHLRLFTLRALREFVAFHGLVEIDIRGATYHDVPRGARWLDRLLVRVPSVAAQLLVTARKAADASTRPS